MRILKDAYSPGQWYEYFFTNSRSSKQIAYYNQVHDYLSTMFSHILINRQIDGKILDFLRVPNCCGKINKKRLKKMYLKERNSRRSRLDVKTLSYKSVKTSVARQSTKYTIFKTKRPKEEFDEKSHDEGSGGSELLMGETISLENMTVKECATESKEDLVEAVAQPWNTHEGAKESDSSLTRPFAVPPVNLLERSCSQLTKYRKTQSGGSLSCGNELPMEETISLENMTVKECVTELKEDVVEAIAQPWNEVNTHKEAKDCDSSRTRPFAVPPVNLLERSSSQLTKYRKTQSRGSVSCGNELPMEETISLENMTVKECVTELNEDVVEAAAQPWNEVNTHKQAKESDSSRTRPFAVLPVNLLERSTSQLTKYRKTQSRGSVSCGNELPMEETISLENMTVKECTTASKEDVVEAAAQPWNEVNTHKQAKESNSSRFVVPPVNLLERSASQLTKYRKTQSRGSVSCGNELPMEETISLGNMTVKECVTELKEDVVEAAAQHWNEVNTHKQAKESDSSRTRPFAVPPVNLLPKYRKTQGEGSVFGRSEPKMEETVHVENTTFKECTTASKEDLVEAAAQPGEVNTHKQAKESDSSRTRPFAVPPVNLFPKYRKTQSGGSVFGRSEPQMEETIQVENTTIKECTTASKEDLVEAVAQSWNTHKGAKESNSSRTRPFAVPPANLLERSSSQLTKYRKTQSGGSVSCGNELPMEETISLENMTVKECATASKEDVVEVVAQPWNVVHKQEEAKESDSSRTWSFAVPPVNVLPKYRKTQGEGSVFGRSEPQMGETINVDNVTAKECAETKEDLVEAIAQPWNTHEGAKESDSSRTRPFAVPPVNLLKRSITELTKYRKTQNRGSVSCGNELPMEETISLEHMTVKECAETKGNLVEAVAQPWNTHEGAKESDSSRTRPFAVPPANLLERSITELTKYRKTIQRTFNRCLNKRSRGTRLTKTKSLTNPIQSNSKDEPNKKVAFNTEVEWFMYKVPGSRSTASSSVLSAGKSVEDDNDYDTGIVSPVHDSEGDDDPMGDERLSECAAESVSCPQNKNTPSEPNLNDSCKEIVVWRPQPNADISDSIKSNSSRSLIERHVQELVPFIPFTPSVTNDRCSQSSEATEIIASTFPVDLRHPQAFQKLTEEYNKFLNALKVRKHHNYPTGVLEGEARTVIATRQPFNFVNLHVFNEEPELERLSKTNNSLFNFWSSEEQEPNQLERSKTSECDIFEETEELNQNVTVIDSPQQEPPKIASVFLDWINDETNQCALSPTRDDSFFDALTQSNCSKNKSSFFLSDDSNGRFESQLESPKPRVANLERTCSLSESETNEVGVSSGFQPAEESTLSNQSCLFRYDSPESNMNTAMIQDSTELHDSTNDARFSPLTQRVIEPTNFLLEQTPNDSNSFQTHLRAYSKDRPQTNTQPFVDPSTISKLPDNPTKLYFSRDFVVPPLDKASPSPTISNESLSTFEGISEPKGRVSVVSSGPIDKPSTATQQALHSDFLILE